MLKITPYLGIFVLIVSIAGLWFPLLGYFLLLVFATLMITSIFRGRWFRESLPQGKLQRLLGQQDIQKPEDTKIPPELLGQGSHPCAYDGIHGYRLISTPGIVNQVGMVFVVI